MSNRRTISLAVAFVLMCALSISFVVQNASAFELSPHQNRLYADSASSLRSDADAAIAVQNDSALLIGSESADYEVATSTTELARTSDKPIGLGLYIFAAVVVTAVILIITSVERRDAKNSSRKKEFLD